jgi:uncharacterized membrane protein
MASTKASITVLGPPDEIERLWQSSEYRPEFTAGADAAVTFTKAPGDRGTEIHVDVEGESADGKIGGLVQKVKGDDPRAKALDDLRRFKQLVETGVITRSEASPEGESVERKFKERPGQPLAESEFDKAEV